MINDTDLTNEYFYILDSLNGDIDSRKASYEYMQNSTAIVHHQVVASSFIPRLFCQDAYNTMKYTSETAHAILCKVMQEYIDNPSFRKLFNFDERLVELILLPRGYDSILSFARLDTFLNEDNYSVKFCEFNGDGSAGMNENREITNSIVNSETFIKFASGHKVEGCNLFEAWVDEFIDIYSTYINKRDNPTFAICDYLDHGVVDEFYIYADLFKEKGFNCIVCDVRDLAFDGDALRSPDNIRIDAIWRRAVTNDVLEFWEESQDLINALRAEKVALIGSFAGHIVHDKQIFDVLMKQEVLDILTADEISFLEQTLPQTNFLDDSYVNVNQIREHKDNWIIKPSDHYGADNVYAGCEVSQSEWENLINKFANGGAGYQFIVQQYVQPFKTKTLPPDAGITNLADSEVQTVPTMYNNMNGLYLYNGKFQGVFSRLGPHPTISKTNDGMTAATIWVDADVNCGQAL